MPLRVDGNRNAERSFDRAADIHSLRAASQDRCQGHPRRRGGGLGCFNFPLHECLVDPNAARGRVIEAQGECFFGAEPKLKR